MTGRTQEGELPTIRAKAAGLSENDPTAAVEASTYRHQLRTSEESAKIDNMREPEPRGDRNRRTVPWLLASMFIAIVVVCLVLWRAVATSTDL